MSIVIKEAVSPGSQSWNYVRVVRSDDGKHKLQVRIHRDAYDAQSFAVVERWDGSRWSNVASDPITACACKTVSYVIRDVTATHFREDAERLLKAAWEIVL